jgi:RHS repeat-associated protein
MDDAKGSNGPGDNAPEKPFAVSAPQVSLPKGGGAIRGIGEKFAANPVTGTGSISVPIPLSPGRSGFGPHLSLSYDSGAGAGPFGLGWGLSLPSITRRTDKGLPEYDDAGESDIFILSGAEDLVPVLVEDAGGGWNRDPTERDGYVVWRYRPRIEGLFCRIERWTRTSDGDTYWRSISRDNVTTFYGKTMASRIADPADPSRVFTWLISESRDDKGNATLYEYVAEDSSNIDLAQANERNRSDSSRAANRYLKRIRYGNAVSTIAQPDLSQLSWLFEAVFDYGENHSTPLPTDAEGREFVSASLDGTQSWPVRQDPFSRYRACFEIRTYRLCRRILMFHHFADELGTPDYLVRGTEFTYRESPVASFITSVTQSGFVRQGDGTYLKRSLPPLEFEYSRAEAQSSVQEVDPASLANLPANVDGSLHQWLDLDGEGLPGVLASYEDAWYYKRNLSSLTLDYEGDQPTISARFEAMVAVAKLPGFAHTTASRHQFLDLAGDGRQDCVVLDRPASGFYKRTTDADWENFTALQSVPNVDWNDPNLRFIDLNGDGHADILVTEQEVFTWYRSLAEAGFDTGLPVAATLDEEQGPAIVFADGTQSIFLADMTGDGLTDIVRVRNGAVCYWPNTGYGNFGVKIAMDNAPWFEAQDQFDPRRIRLTDIDGSGTTDIIYLASDGVRLHFNQAGNALSNPETLPSFPPIDNLATVQAMDLLGNGTACLVWTSSLPNNAGRTMRYVDLMGGQKPHLLVTCINNLGAETHVRYAPSTKFYLLDREAGTPWMTKLPFPVQVVERVETYDRISRNRFVTRYAYHHGYYDGIEREFRGFGMVEQRDTEELGTLTLSGSFPDATNIDAASYVPPMLTKTWFHVGVYPKGGEISRIFQQEYYWESDLAEGVTGLTDAEFAAMQLPDTVLPAGLTEAEIREAIRSLKGAMLHQEIYALDGTAAADRPYSVSEQNLTIRKLQPFGPNRHAVLFTHARESIDLHYERRLYDVGGRKLADPRTTHSMVLAIDDYGNELQSVAIAYGRRHDDPDPLLTEEDRANQSRIHVTSTESAYTNAILEDDAYRSPLPAETSSYEVTKIAPDRTTPDITNLFGFDEVVAKLTQAGDGQHDLPFEDVDATGAKGDHPYRRLIAQTRTLYRKNDLSAGLPLGIVESLALPFESHKLAFTDGLLTLYQRDGQNLLPDPAAALRDQGGYVFGEDMKSADLFPSTDPPGLWWVPSGHIFFSTGAADSASTEFTLAQAHFFLPRRFDDAFGNAATVLYDAHNLLLLETEDALLNKVTVGTRNADGSIANGNDYRVLKPALVTDPNGNRSQVAFDGIGLVVGTAVMGKATETLGDSLAGFTSDLTQAQIDQFFIDPKGPGAQALLGNASARIIYDIFRYQAAPTTPGMLNPAFAATIARETHVSDLVPGQLSKLQVSLSFSDGFGREIQKKMQAEPGPLLPGGATVPSRWVTTGWNLFNNKGKPVRQYEPFFDDTPDFTFGVTVGVSPILFYDPVQRVVATLRPDYSWEKVIFDPWRQESWDANDTILILDPTTDPELGPFCQRVPASDYAPSWYTQRSGGALGANAQDAAEKASAHAGTPFVAQFDTLGRTFLTFAWNRTPSNGAVVEDHTRTSIEFDIAGRQLSVTDALNRQVMIYNYDMLGTRIHQLSMEAGERWNLNDAVGKPLLHWDSRDHQFRYAYDALHRLTQFLARTGALNEILAEKTVYGEMHSNAESLNLRGKIFQGLDGAGVVTHNGYDFKGNLLSSTRQFLQEYKNDIDWGASSAPVLQTETFTSATTYDALDRPVTLTTPDASIRRPAYNEAGLLTQIYLNLYGEANTTPFVTGITYDAKGQRELIAYGNGATTAYQYDRNTFRLTNLTTIRASDQASLQDLAYSYDPVGNITHIQDDADIQNTIYFRNQRVEPSSAYVYDSLYRLLQASGREHLGQTNGQFSAPWQVTEDDGFRMNLPQPGDGQAMGNYTERYQYDSVGNILSMAHAVGGAGWTRAYDYDSASNRLLATSLPGDPAGRFSAKYSYDAHGNMLTMPHLPLMQWDFKDQLRATQQQVVNDGPGLRTYYVYDSSGQRTRKVTENQNGLKIKERIYLGGYEVYREYTAGSVSLERETLHVMDDRQRIALIETRTKGSDNSVPQLVRYQFSNHLGSASLELDDKAQIISYEENFPYGSTSYQAVRSQTQTPKRYRYAGKERDEENGLYCYGARYYAPWLTRWTSCDPASIADGLNQYAFCRNSPISRREGDGRQSVSVSALSVSEIQAAAQYAVNMPRDLRVFSMRLIASRFHIPPDGFTLNPRLYLFDHGAPSDIFLIHILRTMVAPNFKRGAEENLNLASTLVPEIPLSRTLATAKRESGEIRPMEGISVRYHTYDAGGLDHIGNSKDQLGLPPDIAGQWRVEGKGENELGGQTHPASIPAAHLFTAYAAWIKHTSKLFEDYVRSQPGGDALIAGLSDDARRVWQALAFEAPGGDSWAGYQAYLKKYAEWKAKGEEDKHEKPGEHFGLRTVLDRLRTKAAQEGRTLNLNEILTDSELEKFQIVMLAKVNAAESAYIEELVFLSRPSKPQNSNVPLGGGGGAGPP